MISEATPSLIGWAVIVGFFLLNGLSVAISLFGLFATRRETEALKDSLQAWEVKTRQTTTMLFEKISTLEHGIRGEYRNDITTLRDEIIADSSELRREINDAARGVATLVGTVNLLNQSLAAVHARLDSK